MTTESDIMALLLFLHEAFVVASEPGVLQSKTLFHRLPAVEEV